MAEMFNYKIEYFRNEEIKESFLNFTWSIQSDFF
jgi:hypothetical protein